MNLQEKLYLQVQAAERLVANWRKEAEHAETYGNPVRLDPDGYDTTLKPSTLRQCAKELEEALTK